MEANEIIEGLQDFFKNLSPDEFDEIKEAFSVEIEGDVSIDEYLSAFSGQYFYTGESDSSCYKSEVMTIDSYADLYLKGKFDEEESEYSGYIPEDSVYYDNDIKDYKKAA